MQPSDSETESDDDSSKPPPNTSTRHVRRTLEVAKKAKDRPKKNTLPPVPPSNAPLPPVTNQRSPIRDACETLDDVMVLVNKVTNLQSVLHPSSTPPVAPPVAQGVPVGDIVQLISAFSQKTAPASGLGLETVLQLLQVGATPPAQPRQVAAMPAQEVIPISKIAELLRAAHGRN